MHNKEEEFLITLCKMTEAELLVFLPTLLEKYYPFERVLYTKDYVYAKGELPVLMVAHLDTVHREPVKVTYHTSKEGNHLSSPQGIGGDDRCGVYISLSMLITDNLRPSLLFTTKEEVGGVGARQFTKDFKAIDNVNWMLEFDRAGKKDIVRYGDDNPDLMDYLSMKFGFKKEHGSFSDISVLAPYYGISAVNISSAYYHPHTLSEYIDLDQLEKLVKKARAILKDETLINTKYEYKERPYKAYDWTGYKPLGTQQSLLSGSRFEDGSILYDSDAPRIPDWHGDSFSTASSDKPKKQKNKKVQVTIDTKKSVDAAMKSKFFITDGGEEIPLNPDFSYPTFDKCDECGDIYKVYPSTHGRVCSRCRDRLGLISCDCGYSYDENEYCCPVCGKVQTDYNSFGIKKKEDK